MFRWLTNLFVEEKYHFDGRSLPSLLKETCKTKCQTPRVTQAPDLNKLRASECKTRIKLHRVSGRK